VWVVAVVVVVVKYWPFSKKLDWYGCATFYVQHCVWPGGVMVKPRLHYTTCCQTGLTTG